jgi:creatinine amidohydrolase
MKAWRLDELTYHDTRDRRFEVAVLPLGATEPHNLHLPYGTDTLEATTIGDHICQEAQRRGARVLLLPTIPFGTETNLREFPYALNLNPSTLLAVIRDLVASLELSGIRKVLLLNSHGGNDFKPLLRELYGQTQVHLFLCNWFQMIADRYDAIFTHRDDHAGEMETSFALAYFPALVRHQTDGSLAADEGRTAVCRFQAVSQGWVSITRPWHLLTTHTGSGNPHAATAEKGHRLMELLVQRLAAFLVELSQSEIDDQFPFEQRG